SCGLLLEGFAQFVDQAGVLDGDDGLLRKVLHQFGLFLSERPHLLAINPHDANQFVLLEHGNNKQSPYAGFSASKNEWIAICVSVELPETLDMRSLFRADDLYEPCTGAWAHWMLQKLLKVRQPSNVRHFTKCTVFVKEQVAE